MKQYLQCLIIVTLVAMGVTLASLPKTITPVEAPHTAVQSETVTSSAIKEIPAEPAPVAVEQPKPPVTQPAPSGNCADEVRKYGWNHTVALAVMGAESSGNVATHNDDPGTGDYSIGCFQINLLGSSNLRAKYRDAVRVGYTGGMSVAELEVWLKNAHNNVAVAHIMWSDQGWTPWGATTCRVKVRCY